MKADSRKQKEITKDAYYNLGYEKFGPFLNGFMHWLREELKKEKYNKVFFMSRDGYMMSVVNNFLQKTEDLDLDFEYVYFSRNSLRKALLWTAATYEESLRYIGYSKYLSFREIMDYYGFEEVTVLEIAEKYKINDDYYFLYRDLNQNKMLQKIYEIYAGDIHEKSKIRYQMVLDYINQINMLGNIAIVDIGWNGTMQWCLEEIMRISKQKAVISGYYAGIAPINNIKGKVFGYLYNNKKSRRRKEILCFFGVIEIFFQCGEGATKDYISQNGKIIPVNGVYEYANDVKAREVLKNLQEGAMQYILNKSQIKKTDEFSHEDIEQFIRFGKNPTLEETKMFSFLFNMDGRKEYFLPQKSVFRYKPKEFLRALSNSCWKTGFMKAAFKIPFPYYCLYEIIKK